MKKITLLATTLVLSLTNLTAQTLFAPNISNPFGLSDVGDVAVPGFADIDNDGDYDLFVGEQLGDFIFFENIGSDTVPNFQTPVTNPFNLTSAGTHSAPTFGDLDGDGDFDMLSGNGAGALRYFENIGTNSAPDFQAPTSNPFGLTSITSGGSRPKLVDFDDDGDLDVLSGIYNGKTYYFENTGTTSTPAFAAAVVNPNGIIDIGIYSAPGLSDWDFDGDLDLVIGRSDGKGICFPNTGTSAVPVYASVGASQLGMIDAGSHFMPDFIDIDNDGDEDLFIGNYAGSFRFQEYCATYTNLNETACGSYTSPSGNHTWTTSGVYRDTLTNAAGCDSVMIIDLIVNNSSSSTINTTFCTGNVYTSPSGNYSWSTNGTYYDTIPNVSGCDSLMTINLTEDSTLDCGLVAYYLFDNDATDASGNGNHGVETSMNYDNDTCSNPLSAASFDANNPSFINIGNNVKPEGFPVAISCWMKASDIQAPQWIFRNDKWGNGNNYAGFTLRISNGSMNASYGDKTGQGQGARRTFVADSATIQPNRWHHVVLNIKSKTNFEMYIDTVLVNGTFTGSANTFAYRSTANGFIGAGMASQDGFTGLLDEFRVYGRALTKPEVDSLYALNCIVTSVAYENELETKHNFFYPNPANNKVYFVEEADEVRIYHLSGQLVYEAKKVQEINVDSFVPGVYFIQTVDEGSIRSSKLIIQ